MFQGLFLLTLGLFMKVVLADSMLAEAADRVFGAAKALHPLDAWMGVLAFSGQIYFDFAGYSSCAIGAAACLGFVLPENFVYPYAAVGFSDFWRRWHVTLSAWLRDYLYIPIGGNRRGKARTYANLMITMLLGGLWHGANWTFVVWGALHGLYLCVEKLIQDLRSRLGAVTVEAPNEAGEVQRELAPGFLRRVLPVHLFLALLTFFLVNVTWVFFRASDFSTAWRLLNSMFGHVTNGMAILSTLTVLKIAFITVSMVTVQWMMRSTRVLTVAQRAPWWLLGIVWAGMLLLLILSQESGSSFIYFQF
jgi:alginate O-acetyltransferase complex protein AlgI